MPNQITARKTRSASAASVSRWAVGGFDARHQRRPVGDEDEDEQRADEGAVGSRLDPHRVADLAVDGVDDQLEDRLGAEGTSDSRRDDEMRADDQHRHDRPGHDAGR